MDDVDEWLEENDQTQGNEILNTEQIVAAMTGEESDSEDSDSGEVKPTVKMSVVRECADVLSLLKIALGKTSRFTMINFACFDLKSFVCNTSLADRL